MGQSLWVPKRLVFRSSWWSLASPFCKVHAVLVPVNYLANLAKITGNKVLADEHDEIYILLLSWFLVFTISTNRRLLHCVRFIHHVLKCEWCIFTALFVDSMVSFVMFIFWRKSYYFCGNRFQIFHLYLMCLYIYIFWTWNLFGSGEA